jgi:integrase
MKPTKKLSKQKEISGLYQRGVSSNYTWKYRVNGQQKYFATGTNDLAEAIRRVRFFKGSPYMEKKSSFQETGAKYIRYKADSGLHRERSTELAESVLKEFGNFSNYKNPDKVSPDLINEWRANLSKKNNPTAIDIKLRNLKSFFSWCVKIEKICPTNPLSHLKLDSSYGSAKIIFCTPEQRDQLYKNSPNKDMSFILFCGFDAGLRKDEIINARVDWFFLDTNSPFLKVRQAIAKPRLRDEEKKFIIKNKKERVIPLTKKFADFLRGYLKKLKPLDFALQPNVTFGKSRYRYDFRRPFEKYMKEQGLEWVTAHVMRHTFASILASRGVHIFEIAQYLGDRVKVAEGHYSHLIPGRSNIEKLH